MRNANVRNDLKKATKVNVSKFLVMWFDNTKEKARRLYLSVDYILHMLLSTISGGTPYNDLYGEALPERGYLFQASGI